MRAPGPGWARWAIGALVVLRLVYISCDEIRAFPYDETAYILMADAWYWGNGYNSWTYTRQPGFPLFVAVASLLGVPLRLATEALWVGAVLVMARACGLAGVRPSGRVLLSGLLLFHPFTTELFNRALSENLYTPAWMVLTAAMGCAAAGGGWRWGVLGAVAAAAAAVTRQETVLVYALAAAAGAFVVLGVLWRRWSGGEGTDHSDGFGGTGQPETAGLWRRRVVVGAVLPMVVAFAAAQAVNAANWARIGGYVGYDWSLPGFKELYRTLLSVEPESPRLRVPIPADVRRRAAAASPRFAELLPIMEGDPRCEAYRREGERITGVQGEPGSYNLWTMREAIWIRHGHKIRSAAEFDRLCREVAGEIAGAARRGEMETRWAPLSFIPPEWGQLALQVPGALPACWARMTRIGFEYRQLYPLASPDIHQFYDNMALRRTSLMKLQRAPEGPEGPRRGFVHRLDRIKRGVAAAWVWVSWALVVSWGAGWAAAGVSLRIGRGALPRAWWMLAGAVTASLGLRLLLAMTLHATGVEATDRYLFPAAALLVPAGILGVRAVVVVARMDFRRPPRTSPSGSP